MENSHKLSKPHWNNPMWLVCGDGNLLFQGAQGIRDRRISGNK